MPIYEYRCQDCETHFEAMRSMTQADQPIPCVNCEGQHTIRLLSTFNAHNQSGLLTRTSVGCGSCAGGSCASCRH